MADTKYIYNGPPSGNTLADGREVRLHPGATVSLPVGDPWTLSLLDRGHLVAVEEAKTEPPAPAPETRPPSGRNQTGGKA